MKIIVGVDDSPHAHAALEFVRGMKWPAGTRVVVVSAVRPAIAAYSEVHVPASLQTERVMEDQIRMHEEQVLRAEGTLRDGGFATEGRVVQGDPREVLVEVARTENADLLVVGSHGRTGLAKLLMGSVASHVTTHAPCNVLVVKPKAAR